MHREPPRWRSLRKTSTALYLEYGYTYGTFWAENIEARVDQTVELRLDLNSNLRVRNKQTNQYLDTRDLADGEISSVTRVQIDDDKVIKELRGLLKTSPLTKRPWRLIIQLEGTHSFPAAPRAGNGRLYLEVVGS